MEKCILGGITPTDIFRVEKEFAFLQKAINQNEKYLIKIEFYNKLGDILFFKRGNVLLKKEPCKLSLSRGCSLFMEEKDVDIQYYCECKEWGSSVNSKIPDDYKVNINSLNHETVYNVESDDLTKVKGPAFSCAACNLYLYSLRLYTIKSFHGTVDSCDLRSIPTIYKFLNNKYDSLFTMPHTSIRILAGLISDIADAQFGCYKIQVSITEIKDITDFLKSPKPGLSNYSKYEFTLIGVIQQYYFSAKMYKKANDLKGYVLQLTKILYVLKEYLLYIAQNNSIGFQTINFEEILENCEKNIVRKAIRGCWASYENAHMNEVTKQKRNISPDLDNPIQASLNRSSVNSDIEEISLLFSEIRMIAWDINFNNTSFDKPDEKPKLIELSGLVPSLYLKNLVSPYCETDTIINRISRLNYKVKLNYRLFKYLFFKCFGEKIEVSLLFLDSKLVEREEIEPIEDNTSFWYYEFLKIIALKHKDFENKGIMIKLMDENDPNLYKVVSLSELFCHLISDSMYCLNEIIEVINAYGRSYIMNNSFIGSSHEKMIFWSIWYIALDGFKEIIKKSPFTNYFKNVEDKELVQITELFTSLKGQLNSYLKSWMDQDALESHSIVYHAEMAVKRYYSAYETHIGGKSYRYFIDKMFFLNDDFNDKFSHFFAALERYSLNCRGIGDKIESIKKFNEISKLYQYEYFTKTQV